MKIEKIQQYIEALYLRRLTGKCFKAFDTKEELEKFDKKSKILHSKKLRIPVSYTTDFINNNKGRYLYLCWADLDMANLNRADLYRANLSGANLRGANLYGAVLNRADLYRANLNKANLFDANLSGADLYGTDLSGAVYNKNTKFPDGFDPIKAGMTLVD